MSVMKAILMDFVFAHCEMYGAENAQKQKDFLQGFYILKYVTAESNISLSFMCANQSLHVSNSTDILVQNEKLSTTRWQLDSVYL